MSSGAEQHVLDALRGAELLDDPFPYFHVENVFPPAFYAALRAALPPLEAYTSIGETGKVQGGYKERFILDVRDIAAGAPFWREHLDWLAGERLAAAVIEKFAPAWQERFEPDTKIEYEVDLRLVRDFTNYAIGPHTDSPRKLVSLLFYLPPDARLSHLGTSIYEPRDPDFRCEGGPHYGFDRFYYVATAPFLPNSLLGFPKLSRSFHGVEPIAEAEVQRDLLLYNLYATRVVKRAPAQGAAPAFVFTPPTMAEA